MRTTLMALVAASLGLSLLGGPAQATHRHHRHHRGRYHRSSMVTTYRTGHTRPANAVDKASRGFNHEVNNASKSVNHALQGKKPTPQGNR